MFTYFTDRDGKYQLGTLKESAFDPLARTCEFMLKEEAHHMFVGTTGVQRTVERTAELMAEHDTDRHRSEHGGDTAATSSRSTSTSSSRCRWTCSARERSTNVAAYYTAG